VINIAPLLQDVTNANELQSTVEAMAVACRQVGFFYISHHGVSLDLQNRLEEASRTFFALPMAEKMDVAMSQGGSAWRKLAIWYLKLA